MKQLFNKLSAFLVMLMCMSATAQAEVVHHTVCQPTYRTIGFTQECWEQDGKFYFDEDCTDEIIDEDLAKIVVYAKFPSSPVTNVSEFTQSESNQDWDGLTLNWVAETTFESALMSSFSRTPRFVEYKISSENIANARLIWTKNNSGANYGMFTIKIYVNDVEILLIDEFKDADPRRAGVYVESVSDLKKGDILKFEITQTMKAYYTPKPLFLVSLEYTCDSFECIHNIPAGRAVCSKCGYIVEHEHVYPEGSLICSKCDFKDNIKRRDVCEPTSRTRGFTQVCWEDIETGRFYSDEACTQELTGEQLIETVVYKKFPACPIVRMGEYEPYGRNEDWEVTSDWSAETHYYNSYKKWSSVPRYVEFNAASENIADARLVWTRGYGSIDRGKYTISIYVNGIKKFSIDQNDDKNVEGTFVHGLPELKQGDIVKFEVVQNAKASYSSEQYSPVITAHLEYTYDEYRCKHIYPTGSVICSKCGHDKDRYIHHDVCAPTIAHRGFTQECWEDSVTGKIYLDEVCSSHIIGESLAKTVIYAKLPASPIINMISASQEESVTDMDVTFNWPATTNFYSEPGKQCYVEFAALNHNISNARLLWEIVGETNESQIVIHVNDVEISSIISYDLKNSSNIFVYSMPELKYGDIVKFEIYYYRPANYDAAAINACLEYEKEDDYSGDAFWKPTMVVTKKDGKKVRLNADHINKVNWTTDKPNN